MNELTSKQQAYALWRSKGYSGAKAVVLAGYESKTPHTIAYTLNKNPRILELIKQYEDSGVNYQRIISENEALELLSKIALAEIQDTVVVPSGAVVQKQVDIGKRLDALKEILRRFPDALKQSQIQKNLADVERGKEAGIQINLIKDGLDKILVKEDKDESTVEH